MEGENVEIRQHLIEWIDIFLKDGIVPNVVNPKAIKANYILKSKIKDKIEKYKKISNELYIKFLESDRYDTNIRDKGIKCDAVVQVLQELLEED